jgi:Predicted regulator of amino acid metabolism, contains ACT domain
MWEPIRKKFEKYPAQEKVVKLLFERGFQVNRDGKVVSGKIEIPHVQIGKEINVDRRVVDSTVKHILEDETLFDLFSHVRSIPFLAEVAPHLNLGVIVIIPDDGAKSVLFPASQKSFPNQDSAFGKLFQTILILAKRRA